MNLIASVDIELSNFDNKAFPKRNALRQALSKLTALWNKIGRSIIAAEKCQEHFGVALQTPCPTRWNSLYDSLWSFLKHYKSLNTANTVFRSLEIPPLTKEDVGLVKRVHVLFKAISSDSRYFPRRQRLFSGYRHGPTFAYKVKKAIKSTSVSQCWANTRQNTIKNSR